MFKFFTNKILNGQTQSITSAAMVLALASLASRVLGLLRDRLLAGQFGAGDTLDVYYAAFRIPDLVYNLLIMGALSAGFIPVFVGLWKKHEISASPSPSSPEEGRLLDHREVWEFVNGLLNILVIGLMIIGGLLVVFMPFLMRWITPGFDGEKLATAVTLSRIMFLSPLLLGVSSVWGGILQSAKRFFIFSLTPIFYNLGIIGGILFLAPRWGAPGLAWGVALGSFLHMLIQMPAIFSLGYKYQFFIDFKNEGLRRLARLMLPRTLTLAISQLNFLAITIFASTLAAGSLAIFNLAYNIWTFPLGILAASLVIAVFPVLADNAAKKDWLGFAGNFSFAFRQILFLIVPVSALLLVLRAQIVRVILGTGQFGWDDTIFTIDSLYYLTLGLFAEAIILLLVRGFFALEDTKTPFWLGFISSGARIGGAWWFSLYIGVAGLALGYALGGVLNMILLWLFLEHRVGDLRSREILISGVKIFLASILTGASAWWALRFMDKFVDTRTLLGLLTQGLAAGIVGLIIYFLAALLLRSSEVRIFWQAIKNRLPLQTVAPDKEMVER